MDPFIRLTSIAAPLVRDNIDTDAIIPSREMKRPSKRGLGEGLFAGWRYSDEKARTENPEFVLNQGPFRHAQILLAGRNFGCGSSREHAVWALHEWGIRCVIASSFGAIFYSNCVRNGILCVVLPDETIARWAELGGEITADLQTQTVTGPDGCVVPFEIEPAHREMLLEGLDAIGVTKKAFSAAIDAFESRDRTSRGWAYLS